MKSTPSLASRMLLVCRLNRHLSIGYVCPCRIDFITDDRHASFAHTHTTDTVAGVLLVLNERLTSHVLRQPE